MEAGHPHNLLQASAAAAGPPAATAAVAATAGPAAAPTAVATNHFSRKGLAKKAGAKSTPEATNVTLASMVDETGPARSKNLRRLAREAWYVSLSE